MWYPERAVIKTPTQDDAERLSDFCAELGFRGLGNQVSEWTTYGEDTCFDYGSEECSSTLRPRLLHADTSWYYNAREDGIDDIDKVQEEFFMITVDEFITACRSLSTEDTNLDIDFDSIL